MSAFSQSIDSLPGEYYLKNVMETASGFLLKPDSSFEFYFSQGAADRTGRGNWKVEGNMLVLQSDPWVGHDFKLLKAEHRSIDKFTIQVVEKNRQLLPFVDAILVKGENAQDARSNQDGQIYFPMQYPDTILLQFRFCPERYSSFPLKNPLQNYFEFGFETWVFDVYFNRLKLKIIPDGLEGDHPLMMGKTFVYGKVSNQQ